MPQDNRRLTAQPIRSLLLGLSLGLVTLGCQQVSPSLWAIAESNQDSPNPNAMEQNTVEANQTALKDTYQVYSIDGATVHVVSLPQQMDVSVAIADELTPLTEFAQRESAVFAINAGFFDPNNGKTTSHITLAGKAVGNPADNERLVDNPNLSEYMTQILTRRSEFSAYRCAGTNALTYDIQAHDASLPNGCAVDFLVGAGPSLLPADTSFAEAFTDYDNDDPTTGAITRDAIGSMQRNARSAIGLDAKGNVVLFMVEQNDRSVGMTLAELAEFAQGRSIQKLLNLDGGSSSGLYVDNDEASETSPTTYFGRSDAEGNPVERPVKSVSIAK